MANNKNLLPPWKPGQSGNPKGRPKGRKNLASIIRELEKEDFDWSVIPTKGNPELKALIDQIAPMGSPFRAITMKAVIEAISGDKAAREWLRKAGYGDKIDVTSKGKRVVAPLVVSPIKPRNVETEDETAESS